MCLFLRRIAWVVNMVSIKQLPVFLLSIPGELMDTDHRVYVAYVPNDIHKQQHIVDTTNVFVARTKYTQVVNDYYVSLPTVPQTIRPSSYLAACASTRSFVKSIGLNVDAILEGTMIDIELNTNQSREE